MKFKANTKFTGRLLCLMLVCLLSPGAIYGAEKTKDKEQALPEVVVESERLVEEQGKVTIKSEGLPAEVNVITKEDLQKIPYTGNYQDMLRKVPGVYLYRYANQVMGDKIGMRGFSGSHGREVAVYVDGVPMNLMAIIHGTSDIDWLVPEMIERIEVIKGPFSALYGDNSLGGVINITTKKVDSSPSLGGYGGSFGTARGVGVISSSSWSKSLANVTPFLVWEGYTREGYRDNSHYNRGQFFNKFTFPLGQGDLSVRAHYVARTFGYAGYISVEDVKRGLSRKTAINDTDRGDCEIADVVINYSPKGGEAGFHGTLYYTYQGITVANQDSFTSPQSRRDAFEHQFGYRLLYNFLPFKNLSLIVGTDLRHDEVSRTKWNTEAFYNFLTQTEQYKFHYFNTAFYAQGQYKPFSFLKLIGGLRYDIFQIDVDNRLYPQNSGNCSPDLFQPKFGMVITPYKDINIFANKGRSFRSPSETQLSPSSATRKSNFGLGLAELNSWDVGFNALLFNRIYVAFDYFDTRYTGEQWLNPSTLTYENLGTSKRTGIEVELKIFLTKWLTLYGSFTDIRARLKNPQTPGAYYVSGVPNNMSIVGLEFQKPWAGGDHEVGLDFFYRRISRRPLNTTGTIINSQFDQFLWKLTYRYKNWTASVDATLTPRRYCAGDDYYSGGEVCFNPLPKWDVLAGLRYKFK